MYYIIHYFSIGITQKNEAYFLCIMHNFKSHFRLFFNIYDIFLAILLFIVFFFIEC